MTAAWLALLVAASPAPALDRAAAEVTSLAVAQHFAPPVGVYVEGAPAALPRAFASVLAASLDEQHLAPVVVDAPNATEAERLARERGVVTLARLGVALEGTKLLVRGDVISTRVNFWSAQVPTRTGPAAVVALSLDADAQALTLGGAPGPAAPLELRLTALGKLAQWPAALAIGDVDGDHHAELAVLFADRLALYGESRLLARADLTQPLALKPTREPFGLVTASAGRVTAWSMRRERGEAWTYSRGALKGNAPADPLTVDTLTLKPDPGFNHFSPEVSWATKSVTLPLPPQAVSTFAAMALFSFGDGTAAIARGVAPTSRVQGVGTGAALADLDADGTPEVIVTNAHTSGEADDVRVLSLAAFEAVQARGGLLAEASLLAQLPLKARAVVSATGDLDGDGADDVVFALWLPDGTAELVLLRRIAP